MYKTKITNIEKMFIQVENKDFLDVSFDIIHVNEETKEETIVASKRENFLLNTPKEDIENALKKSAETFASDKAVGDASAETEAAHKVADETIAALKDKEI